MEKTLKELYLKDTNVSQQEMAQKLHNGAQEKTINPYEFEILDLCAAGRTLLADYQNIESAVDDFWHHKKDLEQETNQGFTR